MPYPVAACRPHNPLQSLFSPFTARWDTFHGGDPGPGECVLTEVGFDTQPTMTANKLDKLGNDRTAEFASLVNVPVVITNETDPDSLTAIITSVTVDDFLRVNFSEMSQPTLLDTEGDTIRFDVG